MTEHKKEHPHQGHAHPQHEREGHRRTEWRWHRDWRTWVGVIAMLAAMFAYWLSFDQSLRPGQPAQQEMPAAP